MLTDHDDRVDVRQVGGNGVENGHEVGPHHEHLGFGVVHDVLDLRRDEAPVDVDAHGVEQRRPEEHLEMLDPVLVEEGDAVLRSDPGVRQRLPDTAGALVQLGPGERALAQDDRGVPGPVASVDAHDLSD